MLVVLLMGLVNMFRGGSSNTSQKLMRWRVGLQFVAIVVLMLGLLPLAPMRLEQRARLPIYLAGRLEGFRWC